jgi:hypothetical protein
VCTDGAKPLKHTSDRRCLTHREIVREGVERRVRAKRLPKRPERAHEVWARNATIVVRHEQDCLVPDTVEMLEPISVEAKIVVVDATHERKEQANCRCIAPIEAVGVETHLKVNIATPRQNASHASSLP